MKFDGVIFCLPVENLAPRGPIQPQKGPISYGIENRCDLTLSPHLKWTTFQGGANPVPTLSFQKLCNIILSGAGISDVDAYL